MDGDLVETPPGAIPCHPPPPAQMRSGIGSSWTGGGGGDICSTFCGISVPEVPADSRQERSAALPCGASTRDGATRGRQGAVRYVCFFFV